MGKVDDFLVMFGILGALSSSLGLAVLPSAGGLKTLFGWETTPVIQIGIIVFIALIHTFTAYLGTAKGMQVISNIASVVCIFFLLYILITGPTSFIFKNIVNSLGHMMEKPLPDGTVYRSDRPDGFPRGMDRLFHQLFISITWP